MTNLNVPNLIVRANGQALGIRLHRRLEDVRNSHLSDLVLHFSLEHHLIAV